LPIWPYVKKLNEKKLKLKLYKDKAFYIVILILIQIMSQATTQKSQAYTPKPQVTPLFCDEVDPTNLTFTELDPKNERSKAQMVAFGKYKYPNAESNLVFQTGPIKLTQYGIPSLGEYYKTDDQRSYIKVPFDTTQEACVELENMLTSIDDHVENDKEAILKKFAKLYTYSKIVREAHSADDFGELVEDGKAKPVKTADPSKEKFRYCKMKFDATYPEKNIKTIIYVKQTDGTRKRVEANTVTEVAEYIKWGSTVRCLVMLNKLWAAKNKDENGTRKFGLSLKLVQVEVTPREGGAPREDFSAFAFADRGNSSPTSTPSATTPATKSTTKSAPATDAEEPEEANELDGELDEEEPGEEGELEEEPEPTPPPKAVKSAKTATPAKTAAPPVSAKSVKSVKTVKK